MLKAILAAFSIFTVALFADSAPNDDWYALGDEDVLADDDGSAADPDGKIGPADLAVQRVRQGWSDEA